MGAMAVYIYSLNILPYTVRIMIKDSTVIRRLPSSVTIHKGMDSSIPTDSIFSTISAGSSVTPPFVIPDCAMIVDTIPCTMENRAVINSMPYMMAPCASANRIKALRACSGFFMSVKLPQVFTIPAAKNSTKSPYPMAVSAPLIPVMTLQIVPPLKDSGLWVRSVQISASFSFHVDNAEFRFCTIQLSLKQSHLLYRGQEDVLPARFCLFLLPNDQVQDLFCKGDDDTACQRQKPVGSLAGIMAL